LSAQDMDYSVRVCVQRYQAGEINALDDIYDYLYQFCLRVIAKTTGKYINSEDEAAGIISGVVLDALDKYDPGKGTFTVYLGQSVRNRTIDVMRKEKRNPSIPFSTLGDDFRETAIDGEFYENIIDDIARKQEIVKLAGILREFQLSFEDLAASSPRQAKTREKAQLAAHLIARDAEMTNYLLRRKTLPNKILEEQHFINRSILDRYRKYIVAAALIIINDLDFLKPYVLPNAGEGNGWHD